MWRPRFEGWPGHLGLRLARAKRTGFLGFFWKPLFAKIIGNPWEINVSARQARRIFGVLGTPFSPKCLKSLGKSTFRRAKRARFLGFWAPPFRENAGIPWDTQHFGARSAPDSLGFWVPLLGRVLVKIKKSWAELIHWDPEQLFSAIRRVDW